MWWSIRGGAILGLAPPHGNAACPGPGREGGGMILLFYSSLRWQGAQHRCIFPQSSRQVHLQMLQQSAS